MLQVSSFVGPVSVLIKADGENGEPEPYYMTENHNTTTKFRAALRKELPLWLANGLISEEAASRLRANYQLDNLKEESSRLLSSVIFAIGGLLLGGGLISFVAANWEEISDSVKLTLLFAILIALHAIGYWLWHFRGWHRLGHGLIFCGCLVFGANIGLVAQIYHISGEWYGAFGAWALGSLVMAWAVRSWTIGLLALFTSFAWFIGLNEDSHSRVALSYPLALGILLIPLAWTLGSRALYAATAIGIVSSVCILAGNAGSEAQVLLAMASGGLLLWTAGDLHRLTGLRPQFASVTSALGLTLLALTAYIWSFRDLWGSAETSRIPSVGAIIFLLCSIAGSVWLLRNSQGDQQRLRLGVLVVGATLSISAILAMSAESDREPPFAIITNLAAFGLAAIVIGISLTGEQRALFWLGSLYVVLLILSRFLEYETSLLLKSVAFLTCGVAVIFAGIRYEQYLSRRDSTVRDGTSTGVAT
ncbi:MAG: DUF2157 domain-containing protein [Acidobacteriota bacterium]